MFAHDDLWHNNLYCLSSSTYVHVHPCPYISGQSVSALDNIGSPQLILIRNGLFEGPRKEGIVVSTH